MSNQEVIHAYRHLYRGLLRAVQYSAPGRYTARDQLRKAFREPAGGKGAVLDQAGVKRTIWFLKAAQKEAGMEHRILRSLLMVAWHRENAGRKLWRGAQGGLAKVHRDSNPRDETAELAYRHYDMTVAMLNKTMGLCLR